MILLDVHEKPFEKVQQKQKRLFLYLWNSQMHNSIQAVNIKLSNVLGKCSFVCSNFALFRIIRVVCF